MGKNRKNETTAIRFGQAVKVILLCALIGVPGVGYVWQKGQIDQLGREMKDGEKKVQALAEQNKKLRDQLSWLRSAPVLDQRVKELNLGLGLPRPADVWRLPEPKIEVIEVETTTPSLTPVNAAGRQFAVRNDPRFAAR